MNVLDHYRQAGALLEGHFLLASGRHAPKFLQSTTVLQYPERVDALGGALAELFADTKADFVLGPAMGGVVLAYVVARRLGLRALFAEKNGRGDMMVREALAFQAGERFIAIEDVLTTGGSVLKAIRAAEALGGRCVGVGCIINRGERTELAGQAIEALATLSFDTYAVESCPLCRDGLPLEDV